MMQQFRRQRGSKGCPVGRGKVEEREECNPAAPFPSRPQSPLSFGTYLLPCGAGGSLG